MNGKNVGEIAAAALLQGTRYADPFTGQAIDCAAALDIVAEWRRVTRANRAIGACTGMSLWKRRRMAAFFHTGERSPPHRNTATAAVRAAGGRAVASWSSRIPPGLPEAVAEAGTALLRIEDGFGTLQRARQRLSAAVFGDRRWHRHLLRSVAAK